MRPKKPDVKSERPPLEHRALKTAGIRGGRDAPAAAPQSTAYARLIMGKTDQGPNFPIS